MTELMLVLTLLGIVALVALYWALSERHRHASGGADIADSTDNNPAVFRQRLLELQLERERGVLDDNNFAQLETELKRQLLAETEAVVAKQAQRGPPLPRALLISVLVAVSLLGALLYRHIGAWPDLQFYTLQQDFAEKERFTEQDMQDLAEAIDTSLKFRPDNTDLRFWRAQLALEQGDLVEAIAGYRQLLAGQPSSAIVMAHLAQALFLHNDRKLDDEARALMRRAAELDPAQTTALGMLGIDAFDRGDFVAAIDHWSLLLRNISPQAPQAEAIRHALERAKELASNDSLIAGIRVVVNKGSLALPDNGVLYVFAKAAEGPGFPLAVVRKPQSADASWPQEFTLTAKDAMRPDMTLDKFESVKLTARFSRGGSVAPVSGDLEGSSAALDWRNLDAPVELLLDTQIP